MSDRTSDRALLLMLALVPALYGAALVVPGSWLWGVDVLRFLGLWGWGSGLVACVVTWVLLRGRSSDGPSHSGLSDPHRRHVAPSAIVAAALAALLVFLLPDRARFVGDAILRVHAVTTGAPPEALFPQSNSLDVLLHWVVPRALYERWGVDPASWHRLLGAAEAALLAVLSLRFARAAALRGAAALAAFAVCFFGGWLTLFTGLGKGFTEMVLLTLAIGATGLVVARDGSRRVWLGALLALALLTHRSALALVPGVAWLLWRTRSPEGGRPRSIADHLSWLLPASAIVVQTRQLWSSFSTVDAANFGLAAGANRGTLLHPLHGLDLVMIFLFLVPALVLLLLPTRGEAASRSDERRQAQHFLWALALPFVAVAVLYLPPQGLFRDYDGLAAAGMAAALVLAHRLAGGLDPSRWRAAAAIFLWCALPSLWWLALNADRGAALRRVEALAAGPPAREPLLRVHTWDYLGSVSFEAGDYATSAIAYGHASELAPSPRFLFAWGESARRAGDWDQAERAFEELLRRVPQDQIRTRIVAHLTLATAAGRRREYDSVRRHLDIVFDLEPGNPQAQQLLEVLLSERPADSTRAEGAP